MITGSLVAVVTPMHEDGALDLDAYRRLIDWQIEQGTNGIVAVGTTGESPTVDHDEHCRLVETAVQAARGRNSRTTPGRSAPPRPCRSCPTTTSRPRTGCTGTSARWPRPAVCR
jgi:hypothetical protein